MMVVTRLGMAIRFDENDVRPMGRTAVGVRAIRLREDDWCVAALPAVEGEDVLPVTENGYGKRTAVSEYSVQNRGGMGLKTYQITEKTGALVGAVRTAGNEDLLLVSNDGTIIRMAVDSISRFGRATQGVRLMRPNPGALVTALARTEHVEDEESPDAPEPELPAEE